MASGLQNVSYADHIKECHNEFCRFPGLYPSISRNLELTYVKRQIGRPTKIVVRPISGRHWVLPATFAGAKHTNLCLHPNDAWAVAWFQHFEEAKGFFHSTSGLRNVRSGSKADVGRVQSAVVKRLRICPLGSSYRLQFDLRSSPVPPEPSPRDHVAIATGRSGASR